MRAVAVLGETVGLLVQEVDDPGEAGFAADRHLYRQDVPAQGLLQVCDDAGNLQRSARRGTAETRTESWIHLEIDRISDVAQIEALRSEIADLLADVRAAVEDHGQMRQNMAMVITDLDVSPNPENKEIVEFLRWIAAENFVFLGYTHYVADTEAGTQARRRWRTWPAAPL